MESMAVSSIVLPVTVKLVSPVLAMVDSCDSLHDSLVTAYLAMVDSPQNLPSRN